jgi:RNA polymerase sigma factor (sigma-70 family)
MVSETGVTLNSDSEAPSTAFKPQQPVERVLVEAAKAGESTAFATLSERYKPQLLRATYRITRNREDSEDALQDAFLRAFVHLKDFDGRSSLATWLTRIAINSALMILRKKRSSLEVATLDGEEFGGDGVVYEIADRAPNPEKRYAQSEEEGVLRKAIHRLRPPLRKIIEVHQLQERTMSETAEVMCISVAAAKGRLFHAKVALRKSPVLKLMSRSRCAGVYPVLTAA